MHGEIIMTSEPGVGTNVTFTINLPLADCVMVEKEEVLDVDLDRLQ